MSRIEDVREEIRRHLTDEDPFANEPLTATDDLDRALILLRQDVAPDALTVELLMDGAPEDLPEGWAKREADRGRALLAELRYETPLIGQLLRGARESLGLAASDAAATLGWDRDVYIRLESGRAAAALLGARPASVRALLKQLQITAERFAVSLSYSLPPASGVGYGHRPRQDSQESGPAFVEPVNDASRLRAFLTAVLTD